jgi:hypothetical protein
MPWQQQVADVALEIDPETGNLAYREIRLTVPRQSGKTSLLLPMYVWRAEASHLLGGRQRMFYAAQTGKDAIEKFDEDFVEDLAQSRIMRGRYRVSNVGGRKRLRFRSGSIMSPVATTVKAGHGKTLDLGVLDEAFAQTDNRVEAAWRPAMITRQQAQLWIVSTAGDVKSTYLRSKVTSGRAIVESGRSSRVAYFEWSAPHGADPHDPSTWWSCMPALGHTVNEEAVQHELDTMEGGLEEFRRAYLNQWLDEFLLEEWVIPKTSWFNCMDAESRRSGPPAIALDMSPDRAKASVSFAAARADGLPMVQVVRYGDGGDWLVAEAEQIAREKGATCVVVDGNGPASNKIGDLQKAIAGRCPVVVLDSSEVAEACGSIYDAAITEQLRHLGQGELDDALAGAAQKPVGDRFRWARLKSDVDISNLYSATFALEGLTRHPGGSSILY